jgi:hypothetical protein
MMHRARATSAAPRYFKPFHHKATEAVFVDGAINYNNPVKIAEAERRLLWPDHPLPDIVLSLGTGIEKEGPNVTTEERMAGPMEYGAGLGKLMKYFVKQVLDSERMWEQFETSQAIRDVELSKRRYIRLNVQCDDSLPELDHVDSMKTLEEKAARFCKMNDTMLQTIADKMVSTLFYVHLDGAQPGHKHRLKCKGM